MLAGDLAAPAAGRAAGQLAALGTGAFACLARGRVLELQLPLAAERGLLEGEAQLGADVGAARGLVRGPASEARAPEATAEDVAEDVLEVAEDVADVAKAGSAAREPLVPVAVVELALLRVAQDRVGLGDGLEPLLRLGVAELLVGVTPPKVVLDESIWLAQRFAGPRAPGFVNGVLDRVARSLGRL